MMRSWGHEVVVRSWGREVTRWPRWLAYCSLSFCSEWFVYCWLFVNIDSRCRCASVIQHWTTLVVGRQSIVVLVDCNWNNTASFLQRAFLLHVCRQLRHCAYGMVVPWHSWCVCRYCNWQCHNVPVSQCHCVTVSERLCIWRFIWQLRDLVAVVKRS